jgi:hypothetical protein
MPHCCSFGGSHGISKPARPFRTDRTAISLACRDWNGRQTAKLRSRGTGLAVAPRRRDSGSDHPDRSAVGAPATGAGSAVSEALHERSRAPRRRGAAAVGPVCRASESRGPRQWLGVPYCTARLAARSTRPTATGPAGGGRGGGRAGPGPAPAGGPGITSRWARPVTK